MHLREREYEEAHTDFFEAFKNYDESGSPRRTTCLKYLVLANMLMKSAINPFDSQEDAIYLEYVLVQFKRNFKEIQRLFSISQTTKNVQLYLIDFIGSDKRFSIEVLVKFS
jgi:hypothetical protein